MTKRSIIVVAGPTAVGKSSLGVSLAQVIGGEIVSADSVQLYRGFDIGSATPSVEEQAGVRHHMLDVLDSDVIFSASDFAKAAAESMEGIFERGHVPIIVGGSGLYLRALLFGLSASPGRDDEVRDRLYEQAASEGLDTLYERLVSVDHVYAAKIHWNDRVRIVRALEVFELTNKPLTEHHEEHESDESPYRIGGIGLSVARKSLHERIGLRVDTMLEAGLIAEVDGLLKAEVREDCQPMQSIGYKEVLAFRDERLPAQDLAERISRNTRRFAKRQLVWFRKDPWLRWIDASTLDQETPALLTAVDEFLSGKPFAYGESDERVISDT